jgi:hypothetical protein
MFAKMSAKYGVQFLKLASMGKIRHPEVKVGPYIRVKMLQTRESSAIGAKSNPWVHRAFKPSGQSSTRWAQVHPAGPQAHTDGPRGQEFTPLAQVHPYGSKFTQGPKFTPVGTSSHLGVKVHPGGPRSPQGVKVNII